MLTKAINDRLKDTEVRKVAEKYDSLDTYVEDLRSRPQLDDSPGVRPHAPRVACWPPRRLRFSPVSPNCAERSADYLTIAEMLDPTTPRTLATLPISPVVASAAHALQKQVADAAKQGAEAAAESHNQASAAAAAAAAAGRG